MKKNLFGNESTDVEQVQTTPKKKSQYIEH